MAEVEKSAPAESPTLTGKQKIGQLGERWAAWHLREQGYVLHACNWRNPADTREELDLVASDSSTLVFVEVRTRALGAPVPGHASLTIRKKRALRRAASAYLRALTGVRPLTTRFDLLVVEWTWGRPPLLSHYENISLRTPKPFR
jgi:putative endonuclease